MPAARRWVLAAWAFLLTAGLAWPRAEALADWREPALLLTAAGAALAWFRGRSLRLTGLLLAAVGLALVRLPPREGVRELPPRLVAGRAVIAAWHEDGRGGGWGRCTALRWDDDGRRGRPPPELRVRGRVQGGAEPQPGQHVRFEGWLQGPDDRPSLERARLRLLREFRPLPLASAQHFVHARLHAVLPPAEAGLAIALLLGEWGELDPHLEESYRRFGLLHVLAVSGLHLWLWDVLLRVALPGALGRLRLPLVTLLAALAGFGPAVFRAWAALLLRAAAERRLRDARPWRLWAAALFLEVALLSPERQGLGFVLSYSATGALLALPRPPDLARWRAALAASCAGFFGSLPWLAQAQGSCEPWGVPCTPLFGLLLAPRILLAALALLPGLGWPAGLALLALSAIEERAFFALQDLPAAPLPLTRCLPAAPLLAAALGLLALRLIRTRPRHALLLGAAAIGLLGLRAPHAPGLAALPLGHGLGVVVAGAECSLIFDLGSRSQDARGCVDRVLMPRLASWGWPAPSWSVLSHEDSDHASGLRLLEARGGLSRIAVQAGAEARLDGCAPFEVRVLGCRAAVQGVANAAGPVLEVRRPRPGQRDWRAIVLGDQFGYALRELRSRLAPGPVDLLMLPHHGLTTDGLGELLDHLAPREAWASCAAEEEPLPAAGLCARRGIPLRTTGRGALRDDAAGD